MTVSVKSWRASRSVRRALLDVFPDAPTDPTLDAVALVGLASDRDEMVRFQVARATASPPEAFAILASDSEPDIRFLVTSDPRTPSTALYAMHRNTDVDERRAVAMHPNATEHLLEVMSVDKSPVVAQAALSRPVTSWDTLAAAARNHPDEVTRAIAYAQVAGRILADGHALADVPLLGRAALASPPGVGARESAARAAVVLASLSGAQLLAARGLSASVGPSVTFDEVVATARDATHVPSAAPSFLAPDATRARPARRLASPSH